MRRSILAALFVLAFLPPPARAEETRVTILHTTDLHGALLPFDDLRNQPVARGLAKIATIVSEIRGGGTPVMLLDAGDATSGSALVSVWQRDHAGEPEPVTRAMNALGYDAMAVGNHEFDYGPAVLEATRAAANFPWIAANVVRSDGSPAFPPSVVREYPGGVRVGVIGLATPAVPRLVDSTQCAGYQFLSPIEIAQREVNRLRGAEHCDVVIALAHTGLEKDTRTGQPRLGDVPNENFGWRLAHEVVGLDVVILGHTHTIVPSVMVDGTLVTQAGHSGDAVGRVDLTFTRATDTSPWKLTDRRARVIAIADTVATDLALADTLAGYAARTKVALDVVVGHAAAPLGAPGGRYADNALLQLVQRAQLDATGADVSLATLFDGTQRIPAGPVTVRDLMRLYPYENTLVTVELSGADLKEALEHSARLFADYTYDDQQPLTVPGMPTWNFDMPLGVTCEVDLTRPAGDRILQLSLNGRPLDPSRKLRVAVNGYRAAGGGDFTMIRRARVLGRPALSAPAALLDYVRRHPDVPAKIEPAWTLLPDYAAMPERPLIDRLVRFGLVPAAEVRHLIPEEPARRVDLAYGLGRALNLRSKRPSGAFGDVPDEVQVWVDGILSRGVLGRDGQGESFKPFQPATVGTALDWCERAARSAGFALAPGRAGDDAYRRGLLTGLSLAGGTSLDAAALGGGLTRAQWLGMVSNLRFPQVRVIETTDFHGAVISTARDRRSGRATGGTVYLASAIEQLTSENPAGTVLVDGGDTFQGSMLSNLQFGRPVVEQMNLLGYTAHAIGNHDYDWTADTLKARAMQMRFATLGANITERRTGRRPWWVRSDTIVTRRGVRVGILGLAYPGTPRVTLAENVAHLKFGDDSAAAAPIVPRLRKEGSAIVIAVGHIPGETDSTRGAHGDVARLARGVPGVDAWLGGHSHNVIDDRINGASVMIAGALGQWLAVVDMVVDPVKRQVLEKRQRMIPVIAGDAPVDSSWFGRVERWNESVGPIAAEVIGRAAVALDRRRPEATIGDFISDAMRFVSGVDIAMQNPGGMRANLAAGEITRGAIYDIMPFDNTIVTEKLTGDEVKLALEQGLRNERITQVSGLRYTLDLSKPKGSRVVSLALADGTPLDPAKLYKVAVNNFMATGGDNYNVLATGAEKTDTGLLIRGAMEALVRDRCKAGGVLDIRPDGRIAEAGR